MRKIINKGERFRDQQGVISYGVGENSYGEVFTIHSSGRKRTYVVNPRRDKFYYPTSTVIRWIYFDYWREVR